MLQTPLNAFHRAQGAKLVDFAGWEMPVVYTSIIDEHQYTRQHASVFDVSHMGRVEFRGEGAGPLLEKLCTRRIQDMKPGVSRYSHVCRDDGGILDDVIVSRFETHYYMVCNASNREKLLTWFEQQRTGFAVEIRDVTLETAMVALQGPEVIETVGQLLPFSISDLKRYHSRCGNVMGAEYYIARSGYTGEDGLEVIVPARFAMMAANWLTEKTAERGRPFKPAGLGARDTLRLEAAMPLYGHELTEEFDSISAGQGWAVDLTKDFIGAAALRRVKEEGPKRPLVGFEIQGKRVARQGAAVLSGEQVVGVVTSGAPSPTLDKVIAMGFVDAACAAPGTALEIDLRGARVGAVVVPLPFYKRAK